MSSDPQAKSPAQPAGQTPRRILLGEWTNTSLPLLKDYGEVTVIIALVTLGAWFLPIDYRIFSDIYLLAVIALCLRVGRWPILYAAILSALAWNFFIVPPRMSFSALDVKDGIFLGAYFVVALVAGQLTARLRSQQKRERERERRATALFRLSQAMSSAKTFDEGVEAALRQADALFDARSCLLLPNTEGNLVAHPASSMQVPEADHAAMLALWNSKPNESAPSRSTAELSILHLPLQRADTKLGMLCLGWTEPVRLQPRQRELSEAYAAQIALLLERERLRSASEREKLLIESERLHRTLLDSVSHEIKTPLAVLRSASEGLDAEDAKRRQELAREIRTATRRLDHLVANLLNQTRLESGALKPQLDWCDARDLIGAARRAVAESLGGRQVRISIPEDMPLFMADAVLMEQVIANLLLNASRHAPQGDEIQATAGIDFEGKRVFIAIADRGPGIPAELRPRLFQKFQRGNAAHAGGLGLGLSIVRGFMQAQGGEVEADNNPGGGARFTLFLPHKDHETVPNE